MLNAQMQQKQNSFMPTVNFPENKIGEHTKIAHSGYIGKNTVIGKYCAIAPNVSIAPYEHPTKYLSVSAEFFRLHNKRGLLPSNSPDDPFQFEDFKGCNIGNDVWIGKNAVIIDGVSVGDGAVIAANASVVHDVPPYAIVAGSPARIIKYRFSPEIIEKLLELKWWDLPQEILQDLPYRVESAINTIEQRLKRRN